MFVTNISTRLHHVGNVSIAPGQTQEIPDSYKASINKAELKEFKVPAKTETPKTPAAPPAPPAPPAPAAPPAPDASEGTK